MRRLLDGVRDAWLVLGATLALFVMIEFAYRAQGAIRRGLSGEPGPAADALAYPYSSEPWFETWQKRPNPRSRFDPYRGWWVQPVQSPFINVDSTGRRVTPQDRIPGVARRKVFMFGGSAVWGLTSRDSATIPAHVAALLRQRGVRDVEVINFGQQAFNATQSLISLVLELRAGRVPAVAVFVEGNNEAMTAWTTGEAGLTANYGLSENSFRRGRRSFWAELAGLPRHSAFVQRLLQFVRDGEAPAGGMLSDSVCADVATHFAGLVRMIEGLSREFGFFPAVFWQPTLATTGKRMTPWETRHPGPPGWSEGLRACTAAADRALTDWMGGPYYPLHDLFDADTSTVFLDAFGHVTERGNAVIASRIVDRILPALTDTVAAGDRASDG